MYCTGQNGVCIYNEGNPTTYKAIVKPDFLWIANILTTINAENKKSKARQIYYTKP